MSEQSVYELSDTPSVRKPVVNAVSGEFFRKGKCDSCGRSGVERTKTFTGPTMENVQEQADAWAKQPLKHKRCE